MGQKRGEREVFRFAESRTDGAAGILTVIISLTIFWN